MWKLKLLYIRRISLMGKKRRRIKSVVQEYWELECAVCGSTTPPVIDYRDDECTLNINICCPNCGLTVSYNNRKEIVSCSARDSRNQYKFRPKIVNSVFWTYHLSSSLSPNYSERCFGLFSVIYKCRLKKILRRTT